MYISIAYEVVLCLFTSAFDFKWSLNVASWIIIVESFASYVKSALGRQSPEYAIFIFYSCSKTRPYDCWQWTTETGVKLTILFYFINFLNFYNLIIFSLLYFVNCFYTFYSYSNYKSSFYAKKHRIMKFSPIIWWWLAFLNLSLENSLFFSFFCFSTSRLLYLLKLWIITSSVNSSIFSTLLLYSSNHRIIFSGKITKIL